MFLRIILILIIVYYIFKLVGRVILPIFLTHRIKKMEQEKQKAYQDFINQKRRSEGRVTINHVPDQKKSKKRKPGDSSDEEYIDYEEIK